MTHRFFGSPCEEPAGDLVEVRGGGDVLRSRGRLAVEFVAIYVVLPLVLTLAQLRVGGFPVLPVLWLASAPTALWLLGHGFRWRDFFGWHGLKRVWRGMFLRIVLAGIVMLLLVLAIDPDGLWDLPRANQRLWLLIMIFYPLLSVYPQGILYRALFYHRYARLFGQGWTVRLAGAAAFSFCHVFFLNPLALVLTLVGGWFFCRTYERTRSLQVSNLEHALLGALLFTIGLGRFFYHGTQVLHNG